MAETETAAAAASGRCSLLAALENLIGAATTESKKYQSVREHYIMYS